MTKQISNSRGNAILVVLTLVASAMAASLAVMQSTTNLSQIYAQKSSSQVADNVSQLVSAYMSDAEVCLNGFDGATGTAGLQFTSGSFNASAAASPAGQDVTLPSNFRDTSGSYLRFASGLQVPDSKLTVQRVYVANAVLQAAGTYDMDLITQFSASDRSLSPRTIMRMRAVISGGVVSSCGTSPTANSNQSLCEGMNCEYSIAANGEGSCYCKVQPINCLNGTYVEIANNTPQCSSSTVSINCGTGGYLVGLDGSGQKICAQVVSCPAGSSANGLGGQADPPECRCANAGDTWNGTTCGTATATPVAGVCGPAILSTTAPASGLCTVGDPTTVTGSGPWTWTCTGTNSGASPTCTTVDTSVGCPAADLCYTGATQNCIQFGVSGVGQPCDALALQNFCNSTQCPTITCSGGATTTASAAPASPAGCFCQGGQTWDAGTSTCITPTCIADNGQVLNWATGQDDAACGTVMPWPTALDNRCCSGVARANFQYADTIGSTGCADWSCGSGSFGNRWYVISCCGPAHAGCGPTYVEKPCEGTAITFAQASALDGANCSLGEKRNFPSPVLPLTHQMECK